MPNHNLSADRMLLIVDNIISGYKQSKCITRKSLAADYRLRPATVTNLIADLIKNRIICEDKKNYLNAPGRPEIALIPNFNDLNVIFICIDSRQFRASLVNINTDTVFSVQQNAIFEDASSSDILELIVSLVKKLLKIAAKGLKVQGICISLPGVVDADSLCWVYTKRWPKARNIDLSYLKKEFGLDVYIVKNLQAELSAYILESPNLYEKRVLYIHWGEGIGSANYENIRISRNSKGLFGEIGEILLANGQTLESALSLSALRSKLSSLISGSFANEYESGLTLKDAEILKYPFFDKIIEIWSTVIANIFYVLFPDVIIFTGPFVQNRQLLFAIESKFKQLIPDYYRAQVLFISNHQSLKMELNGTVVPFFKRKISDIIAEITNHKDHSLSASVFRPYFENSSSFISKS